MTTRNRFGLGRILDFYNRRVVLRHLAELDDRQLADIGLTRFDVQRGRLVARQ
jgi:uncharacterized protein YjiS (DUF1127 family)